MTEAPSQRTMFVPRQLRVVGAERSLWLDQLPLGYAYIMLNGKPLGLNGRRLIFKKGSA